MEDRNQNISSRHNAISAQARITFKDTILKQDIVRMRESGLRKISAANPKEITINSNVIPIGRPEISRVISPPVYEVGSIEFPGPNSVCVRVKSFPALFPKPELANDAYIKEQNQFSFSSYNKLQGLRHNAASSIAKDRFGNLWFGFVGGGACKFDGKYFTHYTEKEGLSSDDVRCIISDSNGALWFGTSSGVTKYDGKFMTRYSRESGLPIDKIFCVFEDFSGCIWLGTESGVLTLQNDSFKHFSGASGFTNKAINDIKQSADSMLWFATEGDGVIKFDGKRFTHFINEGEFQSNIIKCIEPISDNQIWFGTSSGASLFDGCNFKNYLAGDGLTNYAVLKIHADTFGNTWFCTYGEGVKKFDGQTVTNYTESSGLTSDYIMDVFDDGNGILWFATWGGGVCKFAGNNFEHINNSNGLSSNEILSIHQDSKHRIWLGTRGDGINVIDGHNIKYYFEKDPLHWGAITSIVEDSSSNIWVGTRLMGALKFDGSEFIHYKMEDGFMDKMVNCVYCDNSGNIWFGCNTGVAKFNGDFFCNTYFSDFSVHSIYEDKMGNIWLGSENAMAIVKDSLFRFFRSSEDVAFGKITDIQEDDFGNIWFSTSKNGLLRYDYKNFLVVDRNNGLCSDAVFSILKDRRGTLWFGTRFGLSSLQFEAIRALDNSASTESGNTKNIFNNFTFEDGFIGVGCNRAAIIQDHEDNIWIAANDRLTIYRLKYNNLCSIEPPNIQLTELLLYNERINWQIHADQNNSLNNCTMDSLAPWYNIPMGLSLGHSNNHLTFEFLGITQHHARQVLYQYKLDGMDSDWSPSTPITTAHYGNIQPGNYVFRVRARNGTGRWSDEYIYRFTIRPPWWKTIWAYLFYFAGSAGALYTYIKWRERTLKRRQSILEEKISEATHIIRKQKDTAELQRDEIDAERKRSDELLENILPNEIASELKKHGAIQPIKLENVSVLFSDFVGFTKASSEYPPELIVSIINSYFTEFDAITKLNGVEKIKTIGDAYMLASGVPTSTPKHAQLVIDTALQMLEATRRINLESEKRGLPTFEIRIGIHSGPVVAGIVGVKKFQYDIWGDTVNTASRMESHGVPGRINISESTFQLIQAFYDCELRGEIEVRGKGLMKMYLVKRIGKSSQDLAS